MNSRLLDKDVQDYITAKQNADVASIALARSPFPELSAAELATQIDGKKRSQKKLPLWARTPGIIFPPKLNMEQCSSEPAAAYKSRLAPGETLIDASGGFGVDAYYFALRKSRVLHVELSQELSGIAAHNAAVLGAKNIDFLNGDSILYLQDHKDHFDTLYIDPARRLRDKKVFLLTDTVPNIVEHLELFKQRADTILIKTSPLLDIHAGISELGLVSEVHIVSLKNDCKELLWLIKNDACLDPQICCAMLGNKELYFQFRLSEEKNAPFPQLSAPLGYLYEPDVALMKAGCFKLLARRFSLMKLDTHSHIYTSDKLLVDFPGKIFIADTVTNYAGAGKQIAAQRGNLISRNFPLTVEQLKKKHKITEGGDNYLIFTTVKGSLQIIEARRVLP